MSNVSFIRMMALAVTLVTAVGVAKPAKKSAAVRKPAATKKAPVTAPVVETPVTPAPEASVTPVAPTTGVAAETSPNNPTSASTEAAISQPSETKLLGYMEFRPTYYLDSTSTAPSYLASENTVGLGYQFSKNTKVWYEQFINTIRPAGQSGDKFGGKFIIDEADLKVNLDNLYVSGPVSFSYEPRLRLPIGIDARDAGKIIEVRNYFKAIGRFSDSLTVMVAETPIFTAWDGETVGNTKTPAPFFENRVYLVPTLQITKSLAVWSTIYYGAKKGRASGGNGPDWIHYIDVWPELDYAVSSNVNVGMAYHASRLPLSQTKDGDNFEDGFGAGVFQAFVRASF